MNTLAVPIMDLLKTGKTVTEIAQTLNCTRWEVITSLRDAEKSVEEHITKDLVALTKVMYEELEKVKGEAWNAWGRSSGTKVTKIRTVTKGDMGMAVSEKEETYEETGDSKFLTLICQVIEQQARLFGLTGDRLKLTLQQEPMFPPSRQTAFLLNPKMAELAAEADKTLIEGEYTVKES